MYSSLVRLSALQARRAFADLRNSVHPGAGRECRRIVSYFRGAGGMATRSTEGRFYRQVEATACDSAPVEGMVSFFPNLRQLVDVQYVESARSRRPLVEGWPRGHSCPACPSRIAGTTSPDEATSSYSTATVTSWALRQSEGLEPGGGVSVCDQTRNPLFAFFSRFAARFSSSVFVGFFLPSFLRSIPLLIYSSIRTRTGLGF